MQRARLPFNVQLLKVDKPLLARMRPVTSMDYFESVGGDLHEEGLFSIGIFGRIGDEARDRQFSYINIKTEIFHPLIYRSLVRLRAFYKDLIAGKQYAAWNDEIKDFEAASETTGETGFAFFTKHWEKIEFKANKSPVRETRIRLIEKYRDRAMTSNILVLPAGMRDIEIGDDGRRVVNEVNNLYQRIQSVSRSIPDTEHASTASAHDLPRHMLQMAFNELYEYLETMISGKSGFIQSKWGSRHIVNGTRNVITAMNVPLAKLGAPNTPKYTDTVVGLYQMVKGILPVTQHLMRTGFLADIFSLGNNRARLVNPHTLEPETVELSSEIYDRWTTAEGLEKLITTFSDTTIRHRPVMLDGWALSLIYAPPDGKTFRVFSDINELPAEFDRKHVRAMSFAEMLYLIGYRVWNNYVGIVTRYPVTGPGSTYPTTLYVKTTIRGEMRAELGPDWQPLGPDHVALEFPLTGPAPYLDSLVIPSSRLAGLGADFDGDTASLNILYSDNAIREIRAKLRSKAAYVDPRGGLTASTNVDTFALVLKNLTRLPGKPQ